MKREKKLTVTIKLKGSAEFRWVMRVSDLMKIARWLGAAIVALIATLKGFIDS